MRDRTGVASFADHLLLRAAEQPLATAFTWLADHSDDDVSISYADLDRRAREVGSLLQQTGGAGERALLVFAPGLDFIASLFGCFYAGWIAVPAYPPSINQRLGRLHAIARDAEPRIALTTTSLLHQLKARLANDADLGQVRWRAVDAEPFSAADRWHPSTSSPVDVAVLQYTSGSTATPRGVMVTQANLLHNAAQIEKRFDVARTPDSRGVIWLPPYHDMGLVGGILEGVYAGFPIGFMAPVAFLQRPRRWLEAVTRIRATISGGPNFAFDLCVDRIPQAERAGLDLSSWKVAFNGSEPVRAATLRRFTDAFAAHGFRETALYPCYGLAEATLMVTGGYASKPPLVMQLEDDRAIVGCGRGIDGQHLRIVDPSTGIPCRTGQTGEIWVTGPSVAAGYWRQPALTQEVFAARLAPASSASADESGGGDCAFLRTGDLGFIDADGELFVTGRLKAVLIFGGRKVQAEDIEMTLGDGRTWTRPGGVVALSVDADADERLVIVYEVHRRRSPVDAVLPADYSALANSIRVRVAEVYQLPVWAVVLVRPGGVPRTSSGKIQRAACRRAFLEGHLEPVFEWRAQTPLPKGDV